MIGVGKIKFKNLLKEIKMMFIEKTHRFYKKWISWDNIWKKKSHGRCCIYCNFSNKIKWFNEYIMDKKKENTYNY